MCGDPECGRCFPGRTDGDGADLCECCGGTPVECSCEYGTVPIYDPDGRPTGDEEDVCVRHRA